MAPLPIGASNAAGQPLYPGSVLVAGGPSTRYGCCEAIDLKSRRWLPMPSPSTGTHRAAVAVAPVFSRKGRRVRPVVLVIGGACGSYLSERVLAFDPSEKKPEQSWRSTRIPQLPQARAGSSAALVLPRSWKWRNARTDYHSA